MKKMVTKVSLVVGACLVIGMSVVGSSSASGCDDTQNIYTEGIPYPCTETKTPVVTTQTATRDCAQDVHTEGPSDGCASEGEIINSSSGSVAVNDTWIEGPSNTNISQISLARYKKLALKALPAAGKQLE